MARQARNDIASTWSLLVCGLVLIRVECRTVKPKENSLCVCVSEPMCLRATGQCDALGGDIIVLAKIVVGLSRGRPCVDFLSYTEVAHLGSHHRIHDVFVVVVGAVLAFEWGGAYSS